MYDDKNLTYIIIKRTIIYSLIIIGIMFLGFKEPKPYVLGFIFGTGISVLAFKLLENTIKKAITMEPSKASSYSIFNYFIRYFIYLIVIVVAGIADYLSLFTAVLGLLMIKIAIITSTFYDSIKRKNKD